MYIGIREARPGMTLAEDLQLPKGAGLVQNGRQLSADTIDLLIRSGVSRINVIDPAVTPAIPQKRPPDTNTTSASSPVPHAPSPLSAQTRPSPAEKSAEAAKPPRYSVTISPDVMSARLVMDPDGPVSEEIDNNKLLEALNKAGIFFGIVTDMFPDIVQRWKANKRHYEFEGVAKGSPPEPGKEGIFQIKSHHISSASDAETIRQSKFYWEVTEKLGNIHCVSAGAIVAEKLFDTPPLPGSNVRGEPLVTDQMKSSKITLGGGLVFSSDRTKIIADNSGILFYMNDTIGLFPLDMNGSIEVTVDADQMAAHLVIHPPAPGGGMPQEKEIRSLLSNNRVLWGIDDKAIADLVSGFKEERFPGEPYTVARGQPPQNGENGKIDFLFNTSTSLTPKVNPDGSVDFKNVSIVNSVSKGQELARLTPPTKGLPGKNLRGETIPCKEGSAAMLPIGPNTEPHPTNDDLLVASVDGLVRFTGSYIEICEGYVIQGDVDFSTGNINYQKSVIINGDIKAGFAVECGGDLQVSGIIEDCNLSIGGNLLCKYGFVGQGKGTIEAKGDVNIGFILNQTVRSHKNVTIAKEAVNSSIFARQSIVVHGKPTSVAGGTLIARELISVYSVGNQGGVRTSLEVGLDYTLVEELRKNEEQVAEITQKSRKVIDTIKRYQQLATTKKRFSSQEEFLFSKLKLAMAKIEEQLRILDERKKNIQVKMAELENAMIKIEHAALSGTMFKIGDRRFVVKEEIIGPKTVRLIRQEIHIG
ncbi:MAG: DUF342 domain-containing protein [Chitinispirillaceae bacterium]|nr:DUF342 domain-containing protein [Chitinispirillaceae bacterium]